MRLLILGGTTEASTLARAIVGRRDVDALMSLAGRTGNPAPSPLPCRVGGFGGVAGLIHFLRDEGFDALLDATHPFAARMSANAAAAAARLGLPLAVFTRPSWEPGADDDWRHVADLDGAAASLGAEPRRVFVTSGRLGLSAFKSAPQHEYLVRNIDPPHPEDVPPRCEVLLARGPFDVAGEEALMRRHGIEIVVTKNSGGPGRAKLDAACTLRLPVVLVERPRSEAVSPRFESLAAVLVWIAHQRPRSNP